MSILRPDLMMKCSLPVVMAGIIGVRISHLSTSNHSTQHLSRSTVWWSRFSSPTSVSRYSNYVGSMQSDIHLPAVKQFMSLYSAVVFLGAGLCVGLSGLSAGFAVGIAGDAGVRGVGQQARLYVGMVSCPAIMLLPRMS